MPVSPPTLGLHLPELSPGTDLLFWSSLKLPGYRFDGGVPETSPDEQVHLIDLAGQKRKTAGNTREAQEKERKKS